MGLLEIYLYLFFNSLLAALAFLPNTTMVYKAVLGFGLLSKAQAIPVALFGNVLGCIANFLMGRISRTVKKEYSKKFLNLQTTVQTKLAPLLLLACIGVVGPIVTVAAGFFCIRIRLFLVFSSASWALYYFFS